MSPRPAAAPLVLAATLFSLCAFATERRLTQSFETPVLAPGAQDIVLWMSPRIGRAEYYVRFDNRLALEQGLTPRLQTALYLNFTMQQAGLARVDTLSGSIASEWRYRLLDPVADPVGLALFGEVTASLDLFGLEGRLLADKRFGPVLLAANAALRHQWGQQDKKAKRELRLQQSVGVSYRVTPRLAVGLEALDQMVFGADGLRAGIYLGPAISFAAEQWWFAFTLSPQVASIKPAFAEDRPERVDLVENERFIGRLLVGFHL